MPDDSVSEVPEHTLHVARAKYLTAYILISQASAQLERLSLTRGAYKRTRRSIVRAAAMIMLVGGLLGLGAPTTSHATPVFAAPVANPFGTGPFFNPTVNGSPAFADIDGDGDLDLFLGASIHSVGVFKYTGVFFFENTGTVSAPAFGFITSTPYGFTPASAGFDLYGAYLHGGPELVDIDGDGDLDFFMQNAYGSVDFFQNTGTPLAPTFTSTPIPTGMAPSLIGDAQAFVDIDGDGDLDLFAGVAYPSAIINFQENTGTPLAPTFAAGVADPYGLSAPDFHPSPTFADVDGDGDLDAFIGKYSGSIEFHLNTGTPAAPAFGAPSLNPFGFTPVAGTYTSSPELVDIDDDGDLDMFVGVRGPGPTYSDLNFYENTEINCGDGILDPSEVCDGLALDSETCVTLGYDSGTLACASDCLSFVTTACVGVPCAPTPSGTCLVPGKSQFQLKANADPSKAQLKFKWQKGATFAQAMLGNPTTTTDTALCIYDRTAGVPALVGRVGVPANAFWVDKDPKGFQLVDKTGTYDGTTKVQLEDRRSRQDQREPTSQGRQSDLAAADQWYRVLRSRHHRHRAARERGGHLLVERFHDRRHDKERRSAVQGEVDLLTSR